MEIFGILSVDMYNLLFLIAIFTIVNSSSNKEGEKWFKYLVVLLFLSVITKMMSEYHLQEGRPDYISLLGTYLLYVIAPVLGCVILKYVDDCVDCVKNKSKILFKVFIIISVINFIALTISQVYSLDLFYVFSGNIYHKGSLYDIRNIIIVMEFISLQLYIIFATKSSKKDFSLALWLFPICTVAISFVQLYTDNVTHDYVSILYYSISIYMYMQNRDANIDFLTGAVNRRKFDSELTERVHNGDTVKFSGIMADIDRFKSINDNYGHQAGDDALEAFSAIVIKNFEKTDVIARYGGDEFCILTYICDEDKIEQEIEKLRNSLKAFNDSNKLPFTISVSFGYAIYDDELDGSSSAFLKRLDEKMYLEKEIHHREAKLNSEK